MPRRDRPYRFWTRATAQRALAALSLRQGRTFTRRDLMNALDMPSPTTVCRVFGSISGAQVASGGTARAKHCPRRTHCMKQRHPLVPGNIYYKRNGDGSLSRCCRQCVLDYCKRRSGAQRVVRADVAQRHSPTELARFWEIAS